MEDLKSRFQFNAFGLYWSINPATKQLFFYNDETKELITEKQLTAVLKVFAIALNSFSESNSTIDQASLLVGFREGYEIQSQPVLFHRTKLPSQDK